MTAGADDGATGRVDVHSGSGSYPVFVGPGASELVPELVRERTGAERVAVISDERVAFHHAPALLARLSDAGVEPALFTFPPGEASKTRKSWSILTDEMLDAGFGRDACVVSLGGGVTTDLAGFVAATYMRGVPVLHLPTSLLAMIDASVGGKAGVDVRAGKNLVGAFHAPVAVVADTSLLATLPREERAQGLVEGVKHGAILDREHFAVLEAEATSLLDGDPIRCAHAVLTSVGLKAGVVSQDEREGGYRQILNFGHTIGHAIEAASAYAVGHGTAVAVGMLAEVEAGERMGVTEPGTRAVLERALSSLLDFRLERVSLDEVVAYLGADKKRREGRTRTVLLEGIGRVAPGEGWTYELTDAAARDALAAVLDRAPGGATA